MHGYRDRKSLTVPHMTGWCLGHLAMTGVVTVKGRPCACNTLLKTGPVRALCNSFLCTQHWGWTNHENASAHRKLTHLVAVRSLRWNILGMDWIASYDNPLGRSDCSWRRHLNKSAMFHQSSVIFCRSSTDCIDFCRRHWTYIRPDTEHGGFRCDIRQR